MADWHLSYFATSAPLAVGDLVVAGTGGGEHGARGFVAAFDQATGKEAWRFWTVPLPGEPGSETWQGKGIAHGGAPTWFTGTYDRETGTVFWPTGNPERRILWRRSPAATTSIPTASWRSTPRPASSSGTTRPRRTTSGIGMPPKRPWWWTHHGRAQPRKLLLQANRNGFFYVFDRTDGKLLLAKPFVDKLTWASGIGADGRPIRNSQPGTERRRHARLPLAGRRHQLVLAFLQSRHRPVLCADIREVQRLHQDATPGAWQAGKEYLGGSQRGAPDPKPQRILKAIDIQRPAKSPGNCRSPGRRNPGAARSPPRPAW